MARLFVHCGLPVPYVAQLAARIPGFDRYTERSLVLARRGDVVCLSAASDADYLEFLAALGVGPRAEDIVVIPRREGHDQFYPLCHRILESPDTLHRLACMVRARGGMVVHPFIASAGHIALAAALEGATGTAVPVVGGPPRLIDRLERKDQMRVQAQALGLPIAQGETVRLSYPGSCRRRDVAPLCDAIARYLDRTGRVLVRGAYGVAGSSAFIVGRGGGDVATVVGEIARRADNDAYLVEVMVDVTASPNVQMHIAPEDGAITCVGVTDQRWSRPLSHAGNLFPCAADTAAEMVCWSSTFTEWLRSEGYVGLAGFDFVEYIEPDTGRPRVLFAEVNARINGATFPMAVLERINERQRRARRPESAAFVSAVVETGARSFAELRALAGHLFYRVDTGAGVVPYSSALFPAGKYLAAVLGPSRGAVVEALEELRRVSGGVTAGATVT